MALTHVSCIATPINFRILQNSIKCLCLTFLLSSCGFINEQLDAVSRAPKSIPITSVPLVDSLIQLGGGSGKTVAVTQVVETSDGSGYWAAGTTDSQLSGTMQGSLGD